MGWDQQIQPFPNQKRFPTKVCVCPDDPRLQESPSEFDHDNQNDEILYEDKFCKVTANDIFVKSYYFPCGSSARIPLRNVSSMWVQPEGDRFPFTTEWGSTCGKIWWALNKKRNSNGSYCNVIVLEPRRPQLIGFSVRKRQRFLNVLESVAHFPINPTFPSDYC